MFERAPGLLTQLGCVAFSGVARRPALECAISWALRSHLRGRDRPRDNVPGRGRLLRSLLQLRGLPIGLLTILLGSVRARADVAALELSWTALPECPNLQEVRAEVLRLVSPRTHFSANLVARARIQLDGNGLYLLKLQTTQSGVDGERSFSGRTCGAVADAAIVTMALSLDPNVEIPRDFGRSDPSSASAIESAPVTPSVTPPVNPAAAKLESRLTLRPPSDVPAIQLMTLSNTKPPIHGFLRSIVGWRRGSLPESSGELGLGFGLRRARLSTQVSLSFSPSASSAFSRESTNAGGTFSMQSVEAAACWALLNGDWRIMPCLGLSLTHVSARGVGVQPVADGRLYWTSPEVGLQGSREISRLVALYLGVAAHLALRRPWAYLGESDRIFRPDPLAYQALGGVELRIW